MYYKDAQGAQGRGTGWDAVQERQSPLLRPAGVIPSFAGPDCPRKATRASGAVGRRATRISRISRGFGRAELPLPGPLKWTSRRDPDRSGSQSPLHWAGALRRELGSGPGARVLRQQPTRLCLGASPRATAASTARACSGERRRERLGSLVAAGVSRGAHPRKIGNSVSMEADTEKRPLRLKTRPVGCGIPDLLFTSRWITPKPSAPPNAHCAERFGGSRDAAEENTDSSNSTAP
uniref:uncharacterized protein LOC113189720 n=1 Tax=Urocitellus parryii TaxID=9999 RepID=UPI000E559069|nr:uncharacterized protein LOC113189720 [Urocitellus parryii]